MKNKNYKQNYLIILEAMKKVSAIIIKLKNITISLMNY